MKLRLLAVLGALFLLAGCRRDAAVSTTGVGRDYAASLSFQDRTRNYLVHLPAGYDVTQSYPLLLAFHGGKLGTPQGMVRLTSFNSLADADGFIVVYPEGYKQSWADGRGITDADKDGLDDVGFISTLVDSLVKDLHADPARVYAAGISNGGLFTQRLGCELAGKIAAIGVVSASMPTVLASTCQPVRPVPMVLMAGTDDPILPFEGGDSSRGAILSADAAAAKRAAFNECAAVPSVSMLPDADPRDKTTVELRVYAGCTQGAEVDYYIIHGGGHAWPGGWAYLPAAIIGHTSRDIDASRILWEFFGRFSTK